ncbi:MAG: DUF819 family protein, partial [Gammaproteobacteria bacterium]
YYVVSRYFLPAALILLTLSIDFKSIARLGRKSIIMFLTGTVGIVIGGPIAILVFSVISPETVGGSGPDAVWRGMTTIAGTWIGGGANQVAMKELYQVSDDLFSAFVTVDIVWANIWMAVLLIMAGRSKEIDARTGADTTAIEALRKRVEQFQAKYARVASLHDLMFILAVGFGLTAVAHLIGNSVGPWINVNLPTLNKFSLNSVFFWLVVSATTFGVLLSFTKVKNLEGAGASKIGQTFIYLLVATIGMKMDITAIARNPGLFGVGAVWMGVHATLLLTVAKLIRAPVFYMAVGSQANVGGAASAPVVAAAFHPSLAPVGVMLAVLGYALGTYAAYLCGQLMRIAAGG